jgi:esterase/lipase superfamily enzyme
MNKPCVNRILTIPIFWVILLLTSCQSAYYLPPTPNVYNKSNPYPDKKLSRFLKSTTPEILFVTDRMNEPYRDKKIKYGVKRSDDMTVGKVTVEFGHDLNWDYLKRQSETKFRSSKIKLDIIAIQNLITFPDTPIPFAAKNGTIIPNPQAERSYNRKANQFRSILNHYMQKAKTDEVTLFVHGFNNSFRDAALALASLWHFTGRVGIPIFYTWPAGNPGLFGYFRDRESGEFTVYHLKETLRIMAKNKHISHINIIAHSRGTDVVTSALRELVIEARARKENPRKSLKIQNLILAAPDLDFGVVSQRLIAEKFGPAMEQINVYINRGDNALNLSEIIMSGSRFGKMTYEHLSTNEKRIFSKVKNVYFIDVEDVNSLFGHDYYRRNPGVLSDIALIIQKDARPGGKLRPLIYEQYNFWCLPKGYPYQDNLRSCKRKKTHYS